MAFSTRLLLWPDKSEICAANQSEQIGAQVRSYYYFLALLSLSLTACDSSTVLDKMAPTQDVVLAKAYINDLTNGEFSIIKSHLDPKVVSADLDSSLVRMAEAIPDSPPTTIKIVGVRIVNTNSGSKTDLTFEYSYPGKKWVIANVALDKRDNQVTIIGMHVYRLKDSLEHTNRFTFSGKGIWHYTFLAFAIFIPLFITLTLFRCAMTRGIKRRWLWIIFILFGIGKFSINWTTGKILIAPVSIALFGTGATAQYYSPWIISAYIPLGAILFWFLYVRRKTKITENIDNIGQNETSNSLSTGTNHAEDEYKFEQ